MCTEEQVKANKDRFISLVKENISRKGINDLLNWLEYTDFFTAPASTKYHGAYRGGLCEHSLGVYDILKKKQDDELNESIAIVALLHDLCKANFYYVSMRNVKDSNGKWVQVPYYEVKETSIPLGHGEKSMFLIMQFMRLTDSEALAIRWHMGFSVVEPMFERPALSRALSESKLVLKLQEADSEESFWTEDM